MIIFKLLSTTTDKFDLVEFTCPNCGKKINLSSGYPCVTCYNCNAYNIDPASEIIDNREQGVLDYHRCGWPEYDDITEIEVSKIINKKV